KSYVATDGLPVGYILQYQAKLGQNQKLVLTDKSYDSSIATDDLSVGYILQYQIKLRQNQNKSIQRVEFYDHFNQISNMVPKTAEHLESVEFYRWSMAFCPRNRYNIIY
ncbi:hypothetical protein H5410_000046, partial [Solanum commersonii]